jgi:hypothetical protein
VGSGGKVIPREAGVAEGAAGPVMMGNMMPRELSAVKNEARHKAVRVGCLLGCVCHFCLDRVAGVSDGVGDGACGGVGDGVGAGEGAWETQVRVVVVGGMEWCRQVSTWRGGVVCCGAGVGGGVVGVVEGGRVVGPVGVADADWRSSVSTSSNTWTRLLMVSNTFLTLSVAGREDTSFKVNPRCLRERSAIGDRCSELQAKPRQYS